MSLVCLAVVACCRVRSCVPPVASALASRQALRLAEMLKAKFALFASVRVRRQKQTAEHGGTANYILANTKACPKCKVGLLPL